MLEPATLAESFQAKGMPECKWQVVIQIQQFVTAVDEGACNEAVYLTENPVFKLNISAVGLSEKRSFSGAAAE